MTKRWIFKSSKKNMKILHLNTLQTSSFIASSTQWPGKFLLNEYKKCFYINVKSTALKLNTQGILKLHVLTS